MPRSCRQPNARAYSVLFGSTQKRETKGWVKGSCENCGATTHKTKDCCERPRKRAAKLTGQDIADDEVGFEWQWIDQSQIPSTHSTACACVQVSAELHFDFEGKRDRWNGYDPSTYKKVIERKLAVRCLHAVLLRLRMVTHSCSLPDCRLRARGG